MDRRRLLRPASIALAAIALVLLVARISADSPTVEADQTATIDPSGPAAAASDLGDLDNNAPSDGYPRSPDGAVAAATAYGLALDGPDVFDAAHRTDVLDAIVAEEAHDRLEAAFAEGIELIGGQLGLDAQALADPDFVWRVVPGGWQLRDYDRSQATVAIWAAVVVMADDRPLVEPGWRTTEVMLAWERDGWRLVGFSTEPGPNPTLVVHEGTGRVARKINAFAPYRYWPQPLEREAER
ncbi:MAG: hypothetical protein KG028_13615 [Actinobacteria bacterium]|nr:hypothetical protein [Actinomycetota bacterium]